MENFRIPGGIGRLPCNLSNYYGFTANQWKHWITIYSSIILKDVIEEAHYNCWLLFVRACSLLLNSTITTEEIEMADEFLHLFCSRFQSLYGEENCTCNMHLHLHLKDSLLEFGPLHVFWCFSFERYNGILTGYHTNKRNIEEQLMRRFLFDQRVHSMQHGSNNDFLELLPLVDNTQESSTYNWTNYQAFMERPSLSVYPLQELIEQNLLHQAVTQPIYVATPTKFIDCVLDSKEAESLKALYEIFYPTYDVNLFPLMFKKYLYINYFGERWEVA